MSKKLPQKPIANDELCGFLMALISEAQNAGWKCDCLVLSDGSLRLQIGKPNAQFKIISNNGSSYLTIIEQELVSIDVSAASQSDITAESEVDLPPSWRGEQ
jgi:hypothetical protein